jgi:hypothetical protein
MGYDTWVHSVLLGGVDPQHSSTLSLQHRVNKWQCVINICTEPPWGDGQSAIVCLGISHTRYNP